MKGSTTKITSRSIEKIRTKLTALYREKKFDEIAKVRGFTLLESCNPAADEIAQPKRDCIWYVTQKKKTAIKGDFSFSRWQPTGYCQAKHRHLEKGDLVIYHAGENGSNENHIGIYDGEGMMISKFAYGHVYRHPLEFVPYDFGPYMRVLIEQNDEHKYLGDYATIENMQDWVKIYGGIYYIQIDFPKKFPDERRHQIRNLLKDNNNFLDIGGTAAFDGETGGGMSYSYTYSVLNDFLDNPENRKALSDIYYGNRSDFPQPAALQQTQSSSSVNTSDCSAAVTDAKSAGKKRKTEEKTDSLPPDQTTEISTAYSLYGLMSTLRQRNKQTLQKISKQLESWCQTSSLYQDP